MNKCVMSAVSAAVLVSAISCDKVGTESIEGLPASVKVCVTVPNSGAVSMTKATDEQETKVNSIALLLYRDDNSLPIVVEQPTYGLPEVVTNTSYSYNLEFTDDNLVSGKWYMYALANYNYAGFGDVDIDHIRTMTKKEMDSYIVVKQNEYVDLIDDGLLLTGKFGNDGSVELQPSENDFTSDSSASIHLRRLTAKVIFNIVTADGVEFIPEKYTVYNYSQSSTLMERTGWTQKDGTVSYTYGTHPGKLKYAGAEKESDRYMSATRFIEHNSFTFYMPENVAVSETGITDYNSREKRNSTDEDPAARDFKFAPADASYVVISGRYRGPGAKYDETTGEYVPDTANTVSGNVSYTVHLGNFSQGKTHVNTAGSYDNFTVRRNTRYTYTVAINGVKNIIVEALTDVENNSGAEGYLISNANSTNLELDAHFETVMMELPAESVEDYLLRIATPYENVVYSPTKGGSKPSDIGWVSFARPVAKDEFPEFPGKGSESLVDVFGLMDELKAFNGTGGDHYLYEDGKIYVAAFVDEYFYSTKPGSSDAANISEFVNAADREMNVLYDIEFSKDTYSAYADHNLFSIRQASIKSMYDLSVANPMGIETFEEFPDPVYKKADVVSSDPENWGWGNFSSNFALGTDSLKAYVIPSKLGHLDNTNVLSTDGLAQNYGDIQCISRNRDENGNGLIDREEIKWYLPSHNECLTIWNGYYALSDQARVNDSHQHYTSTNGYGRFWWNDEGSAFGIYYTGSFYTPLVRCVRALGQYDEVPTKVTSVDGLVITVSGLGAGTVRSVGKRGEYTAGHYRNDAADILPTSFRVAKNNLSFTGKEAVVVSAPRMNGCGYDNTGMWFAVSNYRDLVSEGYSLYYTIGSSTTKVELTSEAVTGIQPQWADNKASVNIYATITYSGTSYTSDVTVATVTRTSDPNAGYVYSSSVSHGANNTSDSTYPYVDIAEYTSGTFGFRIANFDNVGTKSYGVNIQRGSSATSASWFGYYPYVESSSISDGSLKINLYDIQDGWYWYVIGKSGQNGTAYSGGVKFGNSKTASIPLSSLVWSDDTAFVTVYTNYTGYTYQEPKYQTIITVTRSFKEGKTSYTVNGGSWNSVSSEIASFDVCESMWSSDKILVKVFNNDYLGAAYLSTITLTRSRDEYSYSPSYTNGVATSYTKSTTTTKSTFTQAEVTGSNFCEQYYYESADKSDLGYWRIPNEREFGLMYQYFSLTPATAARTLYYRKYDAVPTSKPYSLTITGGNIFTGGLDSYVIRCVRDN